MKVEEQGFHPAFLASLSTFQLVILQYELRQYPEDRAYLNAVLVELKNRDEAEKCAQGLIQ